MRTVDLGPLRDGSDRPGVAAAVDRALVESGFFLVTGHGLSGGDDVRRAAAAFFALPTDVKQAYAATVGGRGWLPFGVEANGYAEGTETPPDLKETFAIGASTPSGDEAADRFWYVPNVWPSEVPALRGALEAYAAANRALADELLEVCAVGLGEPPNFFTRHGQHPTWTLNVNRYPPLTQTGDPEPGQYRIGPHTDFGTLTVLDRQRGHGGLQVDEGGWVDAPWVDGALTVNAGDLLARWSGDRWRSARHRVLPPSGQAPDEDLVSLVFFYESDHDTVVEPVRPPVGRVVHEPFGSAAFVKERLDAITQ